MYENYKNKSASVVDSVVSTTRVLTSIECLCNCICYFEYKKPCAINAVAYFKNDSAALLLGLVLITINEFDENNISTV